MFAWHTLQMPALLCFMNFELWPISQIGIKQHNVLSSKHALPLSLFVCVRYVFSLTVCVQIRGQKLQTVSTVVCKKDFFENESLTYKLTRWGWSCQNQQIVGKTNSIISQRRKASLFSLSCPLFSLHHSHNIGSQQHYNKQLTTHKHIFDYRHEVWSSFQHFGLAWTERSVLLTWKAISYSSCCFIAPANHI